MIITKEVHDKIIKSFIPVPPEQGGIIGSSEGIVCEYSHDKGVYDGEDAIYQPSIELLNGVIGVWAEKDIDFSGMVHSHMSHERDLSSGDVEYIKAIFKALPPELDRLYFPLVFPEERSMVSYLAERCGEEVLIREDEIIIAP